MAEGDQGEIPQQEPQDISRRDVLKKGLLGLGALIGVGAAGKKFLDETNTTLAIGNGLDPESKPWLKIYEGRKDEKVDFEDVALPDFLQHPERYTSGYLKTEGKARLISVERGGLAASISANDENENAPNPLGVDSYALFPSTVDDKKIDEIMRSSDLGARYRNGEFAVVHTTARDKNNNILPFDKAVQQASDGSRKILNGPVEAKGIFVPNASAQGQVSREISCYRKPFEVKSI